MFKLRFSCQVLEIRCVVCMHATSQFGLATFKGQVAAVRGRTGFHQMVLEVLSTVSVSTHGDLNYLFVFFPFTLCH